MKRIGLAIACAILLAGCAPNTDEAWKNCVNTAAFTYQLEHGIDDDDHEGVIDSYAEAAEFCDAQKTADPQAFVERWG